MIGSIIFPIGVILGLAVVAAGVVSFGFRLRSGEPINISFGFLLTAYFYLLTIVGLIVLLIGLSGLLNAGLSLALGRDFGYPRPPVAMPIPATPEGLPDRKAPSPEEQRLEADRQQERQFREGLLQGASMVLVGGIVWGVHYRGRRRMTRGEDERSSFLGMAYLIILLAISSIVGVVSLTSAINDTLRFYLIQPVGDFEFRPPPGQNVSVALVFAPVWGYYLLSLLRGLNRRGPTDRR